MQFKTKDIWGIDYGSKLAGTTVICRLVDGTLGYQQSSKKQDADRMILDMVNGHPPAIIMLDAPLSLPPALYKSNPEKEDHFFYRSCDRELGAMSPMFLGGLTARAIKLKADLKSSNITVLETYPKVLKKIIFDGDETPLENLEKVKAFLPNSLHLRSPSNAHQLDALMAWISGYRYSKGIAESYGIEGEGLIWV